MKVAELIKLALNELKQSGDLEVDIPWETARTWWEQEAHKDHQSSAEARHENQ